jgi:uncharacterized protein (TIGR02757 family)
VDVKILLDKEVAKRDTISELSASKPDPIMIAKRHNDAYISLICALFAYGNARLIVKFLDGLDFSLLDADEKRIEKSLTKAYYRFQKPQDVIAIFVTLKRAREAFDLEGKFKEGYDKERDIMMGLSTLITALWELNPHESYGYRFLLGKAPHAKSTSTYKRWLMYLRWMVRKDNIDMGLWQGVDKADLLLPLDTHTFKVTQNLGLLKRKQYDLKAVKEVSAKLKSFDSEDPIKYDFALYRLGQENITL